MALYGMSVITGILISGIYCCVIPDDFVGARAHGDIIIGGLFAVHGRMMNSVRGYPHQPAIQNCAGFEMQGFLQILAMAHTIELINNSSLIPGVKLGYEIYDTCSESTQAISATLRFLSTYNTSGDTLVFKCNYSDYTPRVKAVIGDSYSEVSIAVATLLNTQLIPQVSHASSAEILSDKFRFPAFLRTIPNDSYQTRAMAKLINFSGWNWIGLITMDDDYGRSAIESFGAQAININVCIAFKEVIPSHLSDSTVQSRIDKTIQTILKETSVNVIVAFLKPSLIIKLFIKVMEKKIKKTWIASDSWSVSTGVSSIPDIEKIGQVIGFMFKSGDTTSFQEYLKNLNQQKFEMNRFVDKYSVLVSDCSKGKYSDIYSCVTDSSKEAVVTSRRIKNKALGVDFLSATVQPGFVFSTQLAVTAIAHAIQKLCLNRNCRNPNAFAPWELLQSLKAVNFTYKGRTLFFDSKGDASTGYDVLIWKKGPDGKINITPFAEYDTQKGVFRFSTKDKENEFTLLKEIRSRCSDECKPGQMKKTSASQHTCCYECVACPENHYTNNKDMVYCLQCNNKTHWSPVNSTVCYLKKIEYLRWDDGFAIVLLLISFIGIFIIVAIALLFTKNFDTPVVKASGGFLCYIILFSILLSFVSAVFFIGKPEDIKCKMRQTMFGISFTVAVACILLKSIKILLAFTFEPKVQSILKRLYKPFTLVFVCTGIQIIICTTWLVFWSPYTQENFSLPKTIILECDEGSTVAFGIMLGYIALLTFICFIFAFRGRKLPENYNEAKFITFGMLIYFIAWITFIPIYATTFGIYLPAVEMIVILISNYGILSCTFLPKCYIILCKQDTNTKSAFLKIIYKYSAKSASSLTVSHVSSSSLTLPEGSTTVPSVSSRPSVSCISNSFSFHERLVAADIPPTKARCLQRKRLSSI
ncbi:PREDICTED: G-protein coupled receptor family C group 6 member A-like isoform X1 [Nanorana parkeri]|uniref:G-protein coupled receptor family C group 6 member A-like isoform X1 n=1 Tax=Nanorana parkeri TaxID=125878 RepID=UPI000854F843|nr:PREDICTED: G-protein coupled receptor family C group 6 member A-like isoform X1 [Nanorana parkeri]